MARWDVTPSNAACAPGGRSCLVTPATVVVPALQRVIPDAPRICYLERRTRPGGVAYAPQGLRPWLPLVSEARQGWRAGM